MTTIKVILGYHARSGGDTVVYDDNYRFVFDVACEEYDWLVVYESMPEDSGGTIVKGAEPLKCPKERTIFCTWEPTSIKCYSKAFTRQFGHLLTNRPPEAERHPHYHLGRGYFFWFNNRTLEENRTVVIPKKTKLISAVCSSKQMRHTRHHDRFRLLGELKAKLPGFDWFGRGVQAFGKKYEVLDPYKYHVAVENHIAADFWTEKIADALLCECLPFYAGDPNLSTVLPPESFIPIPIDDPDRAIAIINQAIANNEYEKRQSAILEAKRLLLEKYNFYAQVVALIEAEKNQPITAVDSSAPVLIHNRRWIRLRHPSALFEDLTYKLRLFFRRVG